MCILALSLRLNSLALMVPSLGFQIKKIQLITIHGNIPKIMHVHPVDLASVCPERAKLSLFSAPFLSCISKQHATGNRQSAWPLVLHDAGRESPSLPLLPERRAVAQTAVARGPPLFCAGRIWGNMAAATWSFFNGRWNTSVTW